MLALAGAVWATSDRSDVGHFDTPEGERAYFEAYDAAMARLPAPTRTVDVPTRYGSVRAYLFETPATRGRTPIVLAPGRATPAPMWADNLPGLVARRPVWAIDTLGDAGRSVQRAPLTGDADQVAWLDEALTGLRLPRVHLVAHSFGGYVATRYALAHPDRLASLTLLDPAVTFAPLPPALIVASLPATIPFLPASWRDRMFEYVGGAAPSPDDALARLIALAMEHYRLHLPTPDVTGIPDDELRGLAVPTLALIAERSTIHDAAAAAERARTFVPDAQVVLWPGASHSLPMEFPAQVDAAILRHVDAHDR